MIGMIKGRFLLIRVKANIILFGMNELSLRLIVITSFLFAFSVAASAQITSITITSPSQNVVWTSGVDSTIAWTITGSGNVKIEYSLNGGLNWREIATNINAGLNQYSWNNIPDTPTTQALIRVSEVGGTTADTSEAYFMIMSPQASLSDTVKILPFGDSITFGNFNPSLHAGELAGYRFKLWDSLRTNDYNFDFIGSEYSGYNYFPDYQNGGFGGILTEWLAKMLVDGTNEKYGDIVTPGPYLDYHPANVVLLHMGTTDVNDVSIADSTAYGAILDIIRDNDINTWVVVAKILDLSPTGQYYVTGYNARIEHAARVRINSGYKILIVDMENIPGFDYTIVTGDMYEDGTHPNPSGYAKMANVWYQALKLILPAGTATAPSFSQTSIDTVAYIGIPFNYQAVASGIGIPTYSTTSEPVGMTINQYTGKLNWTPSVVGDESMTITATNGTNPDVTQNLTIHVLAAPSLPAQLVSYWKFDENKISGPYTDTYNTNNAYAYIGPDTISLGSVTGQVGGAYSFDGTDKVNVLDNPDINFSTTNNSFTAEAWINISGGTGDRVIVGKYGRTSVDSYWWLGVNGSEQATFGVSQYTGIRDSTQVTGATIGSGWHHIAGVKNGSTDIKVYVDGVAASTSLSLSASFNSLRPLNIGHLYNTALFNGLIDEVAIYNGALDQATITNHFSRGTNNESYFGQIELVVADPVQDTILTYGENFFIKWTSTGTCNVKLEYSLNGGLNWREIAAGVSTIAGLNQYSWTTIPDTPTTQALIRVSEVGGAAADTSSAYFMIKSPQTSLSGKVKILPFGDSITFGYIDSPPPPHAGDLAGYEFRLWDSLRTNDYNFDFIGSEYSGYNYFPDYQNGGFGGIRAEWLTQMLIDGTNLKFDPTETITPGPYLDYYPADVILLHIGTTIVPSTDTTTFGELLDKIRSLDPNIWVVVAKIIDLAPPGFYNVTEYNVNLEKAARVRINSGYKILIVDMQHGANIDYDIDATEPYGAVGDMYDGTYPNLSGYAKMANVWYQALKLIIPVGTETFPTFSQTNVDTVAYVGIPFNYQAVATGVGTPTYSITSGPGTINQFTGKVVNWSPVAVGDTSMVITATNGTNPDAVQNLTIHVLPVPLLPTELVSYWRFDENRMAGPFTDEYNINNGYLGNADSLLTSITGQVGGAYSFDGKVKINVLDNADLNFSSATNSFTAEAWINVTGVSGDRVVMGKFGRNVDFSPSNDSYWWLGVNNIGKATFLVSQYDGTRITTQITSSATIGSGWHHIAGVKNGNSNIKVYLDGAETSASTGTSAPIKSLRPLNIGHLSNSNLFVGSIDEAALYNAALGQSTILSHYNKGYLNHDGYFDQVVEITINHPEQNETLSYGQNFTIEWNSVGSGNVKIEYSVNGGLNWFSIDSVTSLAGLNNYVWSSVPNKPTTEGLIRIKNAYGDTTLDESTPYFLIKSPQFSGDSTVKILNLGNSITGGTNSDLLPIIGNTGDRAGYEYRLWDSLRTNNYNFDFIGSEYFGYNFFPDYQNAGFPGATTSDLLSILQTGLNTKFEPTSDRITDGAYLNYYPANIILIHTGTNDVSTDTTRIGQMMDYIHNNYPTTWMIIAKILKSNNTDSTTFKNYNTNLEAAAVERIGLGYKILIVDMYNIPGFTYTAIGGDLSDEIHPDSNGYAKMANVWYPALKLLLPDGTKAPSFISPSVTSSSVGRPYNYTAQAIPSPKIYSLSVNPTGMIINQNTGKISWTPDSVGNYPVTILAQNDIGSNSQSFTIDVTNLQTWPANLLSYWRFDDSGSTSKDFLDSYNLNSGFSETSLDSSAGKVKSAFSFDGATNKVNVLDQPEFDFVNSSFTVEAWVKPNSSTGDRAVIGKYGRTIDESYWWLGLNNSNQPTFFTSFDSKTFSPRNDEQVTSSTSITTGSWNHIVGVKDGVNNIIIYVNGGSPVTLSLGTIVDSINSTRPLNIGHWYNKNFFSGSVDEVAIYNKALSQTEITDHYQRGNTYSKGYFDNVVLVKSKIFLQGPYDSLSNSMITVLDTTGLIPLTSPYSQDPRTVDSIPSDIVDWVLVELRSSLIGGDTIGYKSAFLKNDGTIVCDDGISNNLIVDVPPGSYYIVIRHRNHLAVMSSDTLLLNDNSSVAVLYDFTTGSNQFYGDSSGSKRLETGVWGMMAGDANGNGQVQNNDSENYWKPNNGTAGYKNSDFNLNGQVQNNDNENYWKPNNGRGSQVPNL